MLFHGQLLKLLTAYAKCRLRNGGSKNQSSFSWGSSARGNGLLSPWIILGQQHAKHREIADVSLVNRQRWNSSGCNILWTTSNKCTATSARKQFCNCSFADSILQKHIEDSKTICDWARVSGRFLLKLQFGFLRHQITQIIYEACCVTIVNF